MPGLDNGEWFWALYAVANALEASVAPAPAANTLLTHAQAVRAGSLAARYRAYVDCQKGSAKTIFSRGAGQVSAVVNIMDAFTATLTPDNYKEESGYLNDPYEGETMTQLMLVTF